ncbi:MAG TPA: hypothetical protein QGG37_11470 [Chloroflexota bacterium]|nr:hypothetical protein [Chloroflexota bacterium]
MLIDKETCHPVQLIQVDEKPDGSYLEVVIEVLVWDGDVDIAAPDNAVEAGPNDLMVAFFGAILPTAGDLRG